MSFQNNLPLPLRFLLPVIFLLIGPVIIAAYGTAITPVIIAAVALAIGILLVYLMWMPLIIPLQKIEAARKRLEQIEVIDEREAGSGGVAALVVDMLLQKFELMNELANPVMIVDKDFNIRYMNKTGAAFLNTTQEDLLGQKCYDHFKTTHCQTRDCATHRAMLHNELVKDETVSRANGADHHINYASIPLHNEKGEVTGALEAVADINDFVVKINKLIENIEQSASTTAASSHQLSASAEEISRNAKEQSSQVGDIASAIEQMTKTIFETSQSANSAAEATKDAGDIARNGGRIVNDTIENMKSIEASVQAAVDAVHELAASTKSIVKVLQVIDDIADQTNLLALNATIEAASAGEAGKGFAVVANEIRELAKRTSASTGEIESIIENVQRVSSQVLKSIERGSEDVKIGAGLVDQAGGALAEIIAAADKAQDMVGQVAAASEEQSAAAEEISKNIESINSITEQNSIGISEIARSAENLNTLNDELRKLAKDFKI